MPTPTVASILVRLAERSFKVMMRLIFQASIVLGLLCWASAVLTMLVFFNETTLSQKIIFGAVPAFVGTLCGMVFMLLPQKWPFLREPW